MMIAAFHDTAAVGVDFSMVLPVGTARKEQP